MDTHRTGSFPFVPRPSSTVSLEKRHARPDARSPAPARSTLTRARQERGRSAHHAGFHIQESADAAHQFIDIERFVQEIVRSRLA